MPACRLASADDVVDPDKLAALIGPVQAMSRTALVTTGYTAAHRERLEVTLSTGELRRLVVKRVRLATDWTACRTGDRFGREATLLGESALAAVWEVARSALRKRLPTAIELVYDNYNALAIGFLLFALPSKLLRTAWMGSAIHSGQRVYFAIAVLPLVLGPA